MKMNSDFAPALRMQSLTSYISEQLPTHRPFMIGVDGLAGSGKTTFARSLAEEMRKIGVTAEVLALDVEGFWTGPPTIRAARKLDPNRVGEDYDWRRLKAEILDPIDKGVYKSPWSCYSVVIVEGCFVLRSELHNFYDLKIMMHLPREEILWRTISRDINALEYYNNYWRHQEDKYIRLHQPLSKAHLIISGRGSNLTDSWPLAFATALSQSLNTKTI
jgi:uridine kinase